MGSRELDVSASLNVTGVKKVSESKTTVKNCSERLDTQLELSALKEKYNAKCKELNTMRDKLQSRELWYESKVHRIRHSEQEIKSLTAKLEQRAQTITSDRNALTE